MVVSELLLELILTVLTTDVSSFRRVLQESKAKDLILTLRIISTEKPS